MILRERVHHLLLLKIATMPSRRWSGNCQERWRLCRRLGGQFQLSRMSDEIISWRVDPHHLWKIARKPMQRMRFRARKRLIGIPSLAR